MMQGSGLESSSDDPGSDIPKLAAFQKEALIHALTFPSVSRVAYSTCSIHQEENEHVVRAVLQHFRSSEAATSERTVSLIPALPQWHRRGVECEGLTPDEAQCLVRVDPTQDNTNGFFVALFQVHSNGNKERKNKQRNRRRRKSTTSNAK